MKIEEVVRRPDPEAHFHGAYKIPWHERAFSKRLLDEHLDQTHDAASRPFEIIDQHVDFIHKTILKSRPARILDLCCGPGFYTSRLAARGHSCTGIDFAPTSLAYATAEAEDRSLDCTYRHGDVRTADYGANSGLAMMIIGEFTAFAPFEAQQILAKMHAALRPGGTILLEPQRFDSLQRLGAEANFWTRHNAGLFSDRPHLYLEEHFWDEAKHVTTDRYYIIDAATAEATEFVNTRQAYTHTEINALLTTAGFTGIKFHASLTGSEEGEDEDCFAIVAKKR
jgi:SAM-dependent methyltransferase